MGDRGPFRQRPPRLRAAPARRWSQMSKPFELMKLRMLNGSHSTMAYLGYLSGYQFVNEAIADPAIRKLIHGLMTEEAMPTLPMDRRRAGPLSRPAARPLRQSGAQAPHLADRHGRQPETAAAPARHHPRPPRRRRARSRACALGVAAWMRYVTGIDEARPADRGEGSAGGEFRRRGCRLAEMPNVSPMACSASTKMFGPDLPANDRFQSPTVTGHLASPVRQWCAPDTCGALAQAGHCLERLQRECRTERRHLAIPCGPAASIRPAAPRDIDRHRLATGQHRRAVASPVCAVYATIC